MSDLEFVELAEETLFAAIGSADRSVALVSPFLSIRVAQRLARLARSSTAKWSLLTNLDPLAAAGRFLSIDGLRQLHDAGVTLGHLGRLHAKVYLADDQGLLGSANLTNTGLGVAPRPNFELSLKLDDNAVIEMREIVKSWWNLASPVDALALNDLERKVKELPRPILQPTSIEQEPGRVTSSEVVAELIAEARERTLWVKAQFGPPRPEQWTSPHWFSSSKRGRPSFRAGDLVLIYSKDAHSCYAIVEVLDQASEDPQFVVDQGYPEDEGTRWPWVNMTKGRLVPTDGAMVTPLDLGFTGQGLQGGHRRIGISEFVDAVHALAGFPTVEAHGVAEGAEQATAMNPIR